MSDACRIVPPPPSSMVLHQILSTTPACRSVQATMILTFFSVSFFFFSIPDQSPLSPPPVLPAPPGSRGSQFSGGQAGEGGALGAVGRRRQEAGGTAAGRRRGGGNSGRLGPVRGRRRKEVSVVVKPKRHTNSSLVNSNAVLSFSSPSPLRCQFEHRCQQCVTRPEVELVEKLDEECQRARCRTTLEKVRDVRKWATAAFNNLKTKPRRLK